ncbi:hypothetical protein Tco_0687100 [Tanacetum coccineum]
MKKNDQISLEKENLLSRYMLEEKEEEERLLQEKKVKRTEEQEKLSVKGKFQFVTRVEGSSKRAGEELEQESSKKQKLEEDKETAELQRLIKVIPDKEEVAIDAIPLIIRADGSSKRYSAFIHMVRIFDREDLETLWKLVKDKHGSTRPEEGYEKVLWGDLMTMFEPDVESTVWRSLQNEKVLIWKLFYSCGVDFLRLQSMHIFMLVEKRYPLTPATITGMLNKKLQADHWNEMCYQLLKLITK